MLLLAACGGKHEFNGATYDPPPPAPDFTGTNYDGSTFQLSDLDEKVKLLFFGYTFCPDICPLSLAELTALMQLLGDDREDVAVIFVSVDPERDTPERLSEYVPAFDPAFYGVYVPEDELEAVKKAYGVFAEKSDVESESAAGYLVDHTGWIYAIDGRDELRAAFGHDTPAEQMEPDVRYLLRR